MLEARIAQGSLLKKLFEAIKEMVTDVNLECSGDGIQLQAMDGSHAALVCLHLKEAVFEHYRCTRPRSLGLNMTALSKVFKLCGNEDAVTIRQEDESETCTFIFESAGEERVSDFDLRLMQIDQEALGIPECEHDATVTMPSKHFQRICNDLAQFADSVAIEVSGKAIKFSARGEMGTGGTVMKPKSGDDDALEIKCEKEVSLLFAVRYLNYFTKAAPLAQHVRLSISEQNPLEVTYALHNDDAMGYLKFYLAPKFASEE